MTLIGSSRNLRSASSCVPIMFGKKPSNFSTFGDALDFAALESSKRRVRSFTTRSSKSSPTCSEKMSRNAPTTFFGSFEFFLKNLQILKNPIHLHFAKCGIFFHGDANGVPRTAASTSPTVLISWSKNLSISAGSLDNEDKSGNLSWTSVMH